jgi:hypothetical protein
VSVPSPDYKKDFKPGQRIKSEDINKNFDLIEKGDAFDPQAIRGEIIRDHSIMLVDLAQEVLNAIGTGGLRNTEIFIYTLSMSNTFILQHAPVGNTEVFSWNGLLLTPGVSNDFTVSGTSVTLNASIILTVGDIITFRYGYAS